MLRSEAKAWLAFEKDVHFVITRMITDRIGLHLVLLLLLIKTITKFSNMISYHAVARFEH